MKMLLITLSLLCSFGSFAETQTESEKAYFSYCSNFGDGVSFSFSSCVNSNFRSLSNDINGYYSYCSNFGDEVSFSYISCIQSNFRTAERNSDGSLYLSYCSNFDRDRLNFSFVSCVNSNFRSIQTYLNRNP